MSSSSLINSAILTFQLLIIHKTSTPLRLFYLCLPPFHFSSLIPLVLNISGFSFECTDACLPDPVATEASFSLGIQGLTVHMGCQCSMLANDDRTIKVERNTLFLAIYSPIQLSSVRAHLYQKE